VQWFDIHVPTFPTFARTARIFGTVAIEVRFKGCELDPESPHFVSGHKMLTEAANLASRKAMPQQPNTP
jgi:hypothetical protein